MLTQRSVCLRNAYLYGVFRIFTIVVSLFRLFAIVPLCFRCFDLCARVRVCVCVCVAMFLTGYRTYGTVYVIICPILKDENTQE